ncbi:hypothetical protein [Treponema sp. Marseille-Q4130]|uniref:hypothetical protein n=1 Tax=Treponema sp. Marseille-Q4130 TaxID=2766702 RepID=UPI001651E172|nr:hypothetical protein [Treponema sp. Marseille-Q4130]MBC6720349.1 hypothetical protein [Treponema sp. Marseille-Q4130]
MRICEVEPGSEYSELARIVSEVAPRNPVAIEELSFTDMMYLGAVLRAGGGTGFFCITPYDNWSCPLTYCHEVDMEILRYLHSQNVLTVSTSSDVRSIKSVNTEKEDFSYYMNLVVYDINVDPGENKYFNDVITQMLDPSFSKAPTSEVLKLWQDIAYTECMQLFDFRMKNFHLPHTVGKEIKAFFNSIIPDFSLATIYTFIYQATKAAAAYFQEGNVSKWQAANSALSRMRTIAERVYNGTYNRWEYDRPKECPQFVLSDYFFNSVLQLRDRYWRTTPHNPLP